MNYCPKDWVDAITIGMIAFFMYTFKSNINNVEINKIDSPAIKIFARYL